MKPIFTGVLLIILCSQLAAQTVFPDKYFNSFDYPGWLTVANGKLYMYANDGIAGMELWEKNDTAAPVLLADITPGSSGSSISNPVTYCMQMGSAGSVLLFPALNDSLLFQYPGTGMPTNVLSPVKNPHGFVTASGRTFFIGRDVNNVDQLWEYDPNTLLATKRTLKVATYYSDERIRDIVAYNGKVYFSTAYSDAIAEELYCFDPASNTTSLVADLYTWPSASSGSKPIGFFISNNKLYFSVEDCDALGNSAMFEYDGVNTPVCLFDTSVVFPNLGASQRRAIEYKGKLIFLTTETHPGFAYSLYYYDMATRKINTFYSLGSKDPYFTIYKGNLIFSGYSNGSSHTYLYDGINTPRLIDTTVESPKYYTEYNNALYFAGIDNHAPIGLFKLGAALTVSRVEFPYKECRLYPNPATDDVNVLFRLDAVATLGVNVYDVNGKLVLQTQQAEYLYGNQSIPLHLGHLTKGSYTVIVHDGKQAVMRTRMIKE